MPSWGHTLMMPHKAGAISGQSHQRLQEGRHYPKRGARASRGWGQAQGQSAVAGPEVLLGPVFTAWPCVPSSSHSCQGEESKAFPPTSEFGFLPQHTTASDTQVAG